MIDTTCSRPDSLVPSEHPPSPEHRGVRRARRARGRATHQPGYVVRYEDALRRTQDAQRAEDLHMDALRTMARGMAHEMNNLMHGVMLHAAIIGRTVRAESPAAPSVQQVVRCSERGADFARKLLAFAGEPSRASSVDLSALIDSARGELNALCGPNTELQVALEEPLERVAVGTAPLRQVAVSLVQNAVDALGTRPGTIRVQTARREVHARELAAGPYGAEPRPGAYVCLEVTDDGPGISPELRKHIFEPFYANKFTGRGLGLPTVLGIVRSCHGYVQLASEPGQGTCVRVLLPRALSSAAT